MTQLSLANLQSVEGKAEIMQHGWPLIMNGGVFAFLGWYWSRGVGMIRVYATDPERAVLLRFANRNVVLTPHDPQQFIVRLRTQLKTASYFRQR